MPRQPATFRTRRAAAAVEFAIVLPLIVLLLLGSVELGRGVMVQHALQEAAQASCRIYSVSGTDQQDAQDIIDTAMDLAGISNWSVEFDPSTKAEIDESMEPVAVSITVNYADVAWLSPDFLTGAIITGRCVMPADIDD